MVGLQIVVTWLHVLGGIFWFGGTLYAAFVLGPAVMSLPPQTSRALYNAMMARRTPTVIEVVGVLTILLGIVRGTLLGPVRTLEFLFGTSYGITWGIALLLGLAILAWSRFVVGPQSDRMQAAVEMGDAAALRGAMPLLLVELLGFFGIFTCMILMRFGL
jgi:uncharacterized membrane protein